MSDTPLRRTPLFDRHRALGGRMVPFAGWEMPVQYVGVVDEHRAVRERVGLFDVSHMGELALRGARAAEVVDSLVTNDVGRLDRGQAIYTQACNERGTILDDLIVYRAEVDSFLVVCNGSNRDKMVAVFRAGAAGRCDFADLTEETALIAVQGPRAAQLLDLAGELGALRDGPAFRFADLTMLGVPCTVAKTGYTGEDGFEIFCPWDSAARIWDGLLELGKPFGIAACGLGARDTLRLECRMPLYGNEIDETTNPFEAGLGWTVKLDKGSDFVGRSALLDAKRAGQTRKLVGLEMIGRGIGRHGYPVKDAAGTAIGHVTSGSPSPTLGKNIALAYVPVALSTPGTLVLVDCRGKDIEAKVVPTPFYKRGPSQPTLDGRAKSP